MNFLHLSDLHIGKRLSGISLLEDQRHILKEIIGMAAAQDVDAILIAGDLYDRVQPSGEAVELAGKFLNQLAALGKPAFIISGNHDSAEQVAYCGEILSGADIHVSPAFTGAPARHVLRDEHGEVHVYLLPYLRPMQLRHAFPDRAAEIKTYADALRIAVEAIDLDANARNVLVAHQYVQGGEMLESSSEEHMLGGVDMVPSEIFRNFDYVALGHLHAPQSAGSRRIRYCGSPLKYSIDEEKQRKAALRVQLGEKGSEPDVEALPFHPLRDVRSLRGSLQELAGAPVSRDYLFVTLTDEGPLLNPVGVLRQIYPNYVKLAVENSRGSAQVETLLQDGAEKLSLLEHFERFYRAQNNGQPTTESQKEILRQIMQEIEEERHASHTA